MSNHSSYSEFLARCKGPPEQVLLPSSDHVESSMGESSKALPLQMLDACHGSMPSSASCGLSEATKEALSQPHMLIYEDKYGKTRYTASQEVKYKMNSKQYKKLLNTFKEVRKASEIDVDYVSLGFCSGEAEKQEGYGRDRQSFKDEEESEEEDLSGSQKLEVERTQAVNFSQEAILEEWYERTLQTIQQVPCKLIGKAWIKKIQPKKQGIYPYNGGKKAKQLGLPKNDRGSLTSPPWWPKGIPHREPDHLDMWHRTHLLLYILTEMFDVECGTELKEKVDVHLLKAATDEIEPDIRRLKNGERAWTLLCELYAVREQQERYLREYITDKTTMTLKYYVTSPRSRKQRSYAQDLQLESPRKVRKTKHVGETISEDIEKQGSLDAEAQKSLEMNGIMYEDSIESGCNRGLNHPRAVRTAVKEELQSLTISDQSDHRDFYANVLTPPASVDSLGSPTHPDLFASIAAGASRVRQNECENSTAGPYNSLILPDPAAIKVESVGTQGCCSEACRQQAGRSGSSWPQRTASSPNHDPLYMSATKGYNPWSNAGATGIGGTFANGLNDIQSACPRPHMASTYSYFEDQQYGAAPRPRYQSLNHDLCFPRSDSHSMEFQMAHHFPV